MERGPVRILVAVFATGPDDAEGSGRAAAAAALQPIEGRWDPEEREAVLEVHTLPRTYAGGGEAVRDLLVDRRPDVFLLYDVDPDSSEYKLHHLAANLDDAPLPDAAGEVRRDAIIDPEGPVAFRTRLPLDGIWDKLLVERVPVRMAHKAVHVFNHVYYRAMQTIHDEGLPTLGGAIETPPVVADADDAAGRTREALVEETTMVLAVLRHLFPAAPGHAALD